MKNFKPKISILENFFFVLLFVFLALPPIFSRSSLNKNIFQSMPLIKTLVIIMVFAIYEEVFYRVYFPYACEKFLLSVFLFLLKFTQAYNLARLKKSIKIFVECSTVVLFALAHLYLGIYAVFYAAFFGSAFRWLFCKIKNKRLGFMLISTLHIINNLLVVIFQCHKF